MTTWDPMMSRYCKAFERETIAAFPGFATLTKQLDIDEGAVLYLHDDLTLRTSFLRSDGTVVIEPQTEGWQNFVTTELEFGVNVAAKEGDR